MLDSIAQEDVVELLLSLRNERHWAYLVVTHDLWLVSRLCQEVLVLGDGRVVESGPLGRLLEEPTHSLTKELLGAMPQRWHG
jgi:ABC-type dipeptide/oligopeptide/nickel transport system ATPase component